MTLPVYLGEACTMISREYHHVKYEAGLDSPEAQGLLERHHHVQYETGLPPSLCVFGSVIITM